MDAVEYKHVVLGLVFLRHVSDSFMGRHEKTASAKRGDPENGDGHAPDGVFRVPEGARWPGIAAKSRQPSIGKTIDGAMVRIEGENPALRDVMPKIYGSPRTERSALGRLVDTIDGIPTGDRESRPQNALGRIYEHFLHRFAGSEGKRGGGFCTPPGVVRLLVNMLEPHDGAVYDPCCGASGTLVQSMEFMRSRAAGNVGGARDSLRVFGQESSRTTWRLARMNLAIHGIEGSVEHGDSLRGDLHPDLEADFILASPPFNAGSWGGEQLRGDVRWKYGTPPTANANFAWIQHAIHHLSPRGVAGLVLDNRSMSSTNSGEGDIRGNMVESDLVDCMVALPGQLFYSTQIPACLWFVSRRRKDRGYKRRGKVLFVDARGMGRMEDRTRRVLDDADVREIADTYHAWQSEEGYKDVPGFCKSADVEEIRRRGHALAPGLYVGAAPQEDDGEPFGRRMRRLVAEWREQQSEARRLDGEIANYMKNMGFDTAGDAA